MLARAFFCEFAKAFVCHAIHAIHCNKRLLPFGRKHSCRSGFLQYLQRLNVLIRIDEPARTMPSIRTDINRFVSLRCGSQFGIRSGISIIISCRTMNIGKDFFARHLRPSSASCKNEEKEKC